MLAALLSPYSDKPLKPSDFLDSKPTSPTDIAKFASVVSGQPVNQAAAVEQFVESGHAPFQPPPD